MSENVRKDPFAKAHLHDAEERVREKADEAQARAHEAYDQARERIDEGIAQGRAEAERLSGHSAQLVRDNPGLALVGALGAGVLLGLALRKTG